MATRTAWAHTSQSMPKTVICTRRNSACAVAANTNNAVSKRSVLIGPSMAFALMLEVEVAEVDGEAHALFRKQRRDREIHRELHAELHSVDFLDAQRGRSNEDLLRFAARDLHSAGTDGAGTFA